MGLADIKEFIDINRSQKILSGVDGIKSILWILLILRGVWCHVVYLLLSGTLKVEPF